VTTVEPVAETPAALAEYAARAAARVLTGAVDAHGEATWVLAGGGTPLGAYRLLERRLAATVPWERIRFAMGDERVVPRDHPDSNWGQASEALLDRVATGEGMLLAPRTDLPPDEAAADYDRQVRALPKAASGWPRLDLIWLGVGEDGHTLSLFPGHPEAEVDDRLVVAVRNSPKPPPDRLSLTLPALRGACCCMVLAAGAGKADAVAHALAGDERLPLTRAVREVTRSGGTVTWLLDRAAAAHQEGISDPRPHRP
jgi:6-phosphogluconolactonase